MGLPSDEVILEDCARCPEFIVIVLRGMERRNTHLKRQVEFLARELEKQGYAFTAEDWMTMAERETRGDTR